MTGGGKSFVVWTLAILKALQYKGIRIGIARETLTQLKRNSIASFYEVIRHLNIPETFYKYNEMKGEIKFNNGSTINFFELRYLPSDPNYDRFGGALLTFGIIEEAAGTDSRGMEVFSSRLGRWMNDEYNIPGHLYLTTNPGTNYVYSQFYLPWTKNELKDYKIFIPSKISDNKKIGKNYEESLRKRLNKSNADRLLKGEWNFDDDNTRLCKYQDVMNILNINDIIEQSNQDYYISADIAFTSDKCIIILWKGLHIIKIYQLTKEQEVEVEIEKLVLEYNVNPRNVVYDADGVGKYLKQKLPQAYDFINNSKPIDNENYQNLKTQCYYKLADLINENKIKVISELDENIKNDLIQEIYEIKSIPLESTDAKLKLVSKKDIKKIIGRSPDISDAIAFRMVFEITGPVVKSYYTRSRR